VQIQDLTAESNVLPGKFSLLFGQLFDEQKLDVCTKNANVTSTKRVKFLGRSSELFDYENQAGFSLNFAVGCLAEGLLGNQAGNGHWATCSPMASANGPRLMSLN
jgi:hypothetical protein